MFGFLPRQTRLLTRVTVAPGPATMSLTAQIKTAALAQGFDVVGVAAVDAGPPTGDSAETSLPTQLRARLSAWLSAGYHATMAWMTRTPERRADPRLVLPGCRAVIVVGLNYDSGAHPDEGPGMGRIARYAWGRDYHLTMGDRLTRLTETLTTLAPEASHKWYVDTGPVMEKAWAQQAGVGWIGKHSNLVSAEHGSWLVLGVILTTLPLTPDPPGTDLCGTCTLCLQACPTEAMPTPYVVDARRCLSYLTIEHRGADLPPDLARDIGTHLFGCDDCLDVCPYNTQATPSTDPAWAPRVWTLRPALAELSSWNEPEFLARTVESPIRRTRYAGFQRNLRLVQDQIGQPATDHTPPATRPVDPGKPRGV